MIVAATRRTFDLWMTLLSVFGGGLATVVAVWLGARLALRNDRSKRAEERAEERKADDVRRRHDVAERLRAEVRAIVRLFPEIHEEIERASVPTKVEGRDVNRLLRRAAEKLDRYTDDLEHQLADAIPDVTEDVIESVKSTVAALRILESALRTGVTPGFGFIGPTSEDLLKAIGNGIRDMEAVPLHYLETGLTALIKGVPESEVQSFYGRLSFVEEARQAAIAQRSGGPAPATPDMET